MDRILADLATVEPLLRKAADHEIRTTIPLADVVAKVLSLAGVSPDAPRTRVNTGPDQQAPALLRTRTRPCALSASRDHKAVAERQEGTARRCKLGRVTGAGADGSGEAGSGRPFSIRPVSDDQWVIVAWLYGHVLLAHVRQHQADLDFDIGAVETYTAQQRIHTCSSCTTSGPVNPNSVRRNPGRAAASRTKVFTRTSTSQACLGLLPHGHPRRPALRPRSTSASAW